METEKEYKKLKEKFQLPSLEEIDVDFDLGNLEDKNILRGIRKKMSEKLEIYAKYLEELIQPDSTFSSMYEIKYLTDEDKKKILIIFKKMMVLYRESVKINLGMGEEMDAKFISDLYSVWKDIKTELAEVIDTTKESWKKEETADFDSEYFG